MDENLEKYIGIIMNKKEVTEGVYIYFPDHMTEGYLLREDDEDDPEEELLFEDLYSGDHFLQYNDVHGAFSNENVVGFLVKEKDLIKNEDGLSLEEAKQEYFDDAKEQTIVGFYIYGQNSIKFLKLGLGDLFYYINDLNLNTTDPFEFLSGEKLYEKLLSPNEKLSTLTTDNALSIGGANEYEDSILITVEDLDKLLKLDLRDMKNSLTEIRKEYDKIMKMSDDYDDSEEKKDAKDNQQEAIKKVEEVYNHLLSIDDIDLLKEAIQKAADEYTNIVISLDDSIKDEKAHDEATDFFYKKIDELEELIKLDDIISIKKKINNIKNKEIDHVGNMKEFDYNNYFEHEKKEKELNEVFNKNEKTNTKARFNPREMKEFFDKKIIGQEQAKIDVISSLFMNSLIDDPGSKNSCLLIGPTGSGKTLIAETVSEFLDLPFVCIDTTQLTSPGYVGADIEDFLSRLIASADNDVEKAERGVVVLDEIDKKGTDNNGDVSGRGVLNTLLPFIQGTTYDVPISSVSKRKVSFDTSKLTIFATGAFTDVAKNKKSTIGFSAEVKEDKDEDIEYKKIDREDLVKEGNMPIELIGRFSTITQLSGHTKESLKTILTDSNISTLLKEKEKLDVVGISISWTDDYIEKVAEQALKLKVGARSLKATIEESIKLARWEAINNQEQIAGIILNGESVTSPEKATLIYKDGGLNTVEEIRNNKEISKTKVKRDDK